MGKPIGANLLTAGYTLLVVVHRNQTPIDDLVDRGAKEMESYDEIVSEADVVILNLPSSIEVEEVIYSPGNLLEALSNGKIVIDMGTSDPSSTIKIAEDLAKRGVDMLDSPVSGGEVGATEGTLSVMVGGKRKVFEQMLPLLQVIGSTINYIGGHGIISMEYIVLGWFVKYMSHFAYSKVSRVPYLLRD